MRRNIRQRVLLAVLLLAIAPGITSCKWEQRRELSRNREKWVAQDINDYRYKVSIISYWGENALMPLTMVYQNGELVSVTDVDGNTQDSFWGKQGGIDAVFQEVEDALARNKREVTEIEFDPTYGYPSYVNIFYHETGVGAEYDRRYTISDFEVLTNP